MRRRKLLNPNFGRPRIIFAQEWKWAREKIVKLSKNSGVKWLLRGLRNHPEHKVNESFDTNNGDHSTPPLVTLAEWT